MRITNQPNEQIKAALETEHLKTLRRLMHGRDFANTIPMHTANMNMIIEGEDVIKKTIVPELAVYMDRSSMTKNEQISRGGIEYRIALNHEAFPISHVYKDSGYLCLGNIFVPNLVSVYNPLQPLETLLLHNDRNKNHGNPQIKTTLTLRRQILDFLNMDNINFTETLPVDLLDSDWIGNDTLWVLGAWLLERLPKEQAFEKMQTIFQMIFKDNNY